MEEYASNSNKSRDRRNENLPEKKIEKAIDGNAKIKKKSGFEKVAKVFVPEDVDNVKQYILEDVVAPAAKDVILDVVKAILGISGNGSGSRRASTASKISYRKYYEDDRRDDRIRPGSRVNGYEYDDILFDNRGQAERALTALDEIMSVYGVVSVHDFYDVAGISTDNYTTEKYGWTDIRSASITRVRDGYMIRMPRALPIN